MQSSNPILSKRDSFSRTGTVGFDAPPPSVSDLQHMYDAPAARRMTLDDVIAKTGITLGVLLVAGAAAWVLVPPGAFGFILPMALVGLGLGLFISFKRAISPPLILAYAAVQGVLLGTISSVFESAYSGIVVQAVLGTAIVFAVTLAAYKSGRIRVTPRFTKVVVIAGFAAMGLMLVNLLAGMIGVGDGAGLGLRGDSPLGILFGLAMVGLGAMFLVLDFEQVQRGVAMGAPERESWLAAFGLTVTLIWIYMEILRLISYFRSE
jgi:uncharacterized YccA/Bax inhibitor family protein